MILNSRFFRIFWGPASPLYTLAGTALLIMASARTAFALITLGALIWVYTLTAAAIRLARRFLPKRGRSLVIIGISSALGGLYLLVLYLLNPLLALESTLYILLAPVCCSVSALLDRIETLEGSEGILEALLEALLYGALLFALALIREFMGLGALSLPGGSGGMVELFRRREFSLIPVRFLDSAAGALLLLGYGIAFFNRLLKTRQDAAAGREEPK